jgi:hypothetical protein
MELYKRSYFVAYKSPAVEDFTTATTAGAGACHGSFTMLFSFINKRQLKFDGWEMLDVDGTNEW